MLFAFLFCCMSEGLKPLSGWPPSTAPKGRVGLYGHPPLHYLCEDWHPWVLSHNVNTTCKREGPVCFLELCLRQFLWVLWAAKRTGWGRVRLSLGARWMQMAAGLSGHGWSPHVCRCAACSGCAGEPQDRHVGCLQQRDGLIMPIVHLLLLPGSKRWGIQNRKWSWGKFFLDEDFVAHF